MQKRVEAETVKTGSLVTPAKLFTDLVGALDAERAELQFDADTHTLTVSTVQDNVQLQCGLRDMFPSFPNPQLSDRADADIRTLLRAIEQTAFAVSPDDDNVLSGVHFDLTGDELKLAACDGSRLSERRMRVRRHGALELAVTVPAFSLRCLHELLQSEEGRVSIGKEADGRSINLTAGKSQMVSSVFEQTYPAYANAIPTGVLSSCRVVRRELQGKLRAALLLAPTAGHRLGLALVGDSTLRLTALGGELGSTKHELNSHNQGSEEEIFVDGDALANGVDVMEGESVDLSFAANRHLLVRPAARDDHLYVLWRLTVPPALEFKDRSF